MKKPERPIGLEVEKETIGGKLLNIGIIILIVLIEWYLLDKWFLLSIS